MKISRFIIALSASAALSSISHAADLPTMKSAPAPAPVYAQGYNWTGFYIGGYAGGSFGSAKVSDVTSPNFLNIPNFSPDGFTAGGLAGYSIQFNSFVVGAEGEFGYDGRRASASYVGGGGDIRTTKFEGSYIGRIRGDVGYAFDNILVYVAGGVSFADAKLSVFRPANGFGQSQTAQLVGYNVGAGIRYAFTRNWIARVEYIYDGFNSHTYDFLSQNPNGFDNRKAKYNENTVRAALEYKF